MKVCLISVVVNRDINVGGCWGVVKSTFTDGVMLVVVDFNGSSPHHHEGAWCR